MKITVRLPWPTTQPNEDFGSLFRDPGDDVYEIFDRGEILVNYTKYPYGLFKLRSETVAAKLTHITGTGDIFAVGDARTKGPQNHYGEGTFFIEGASKATFSLQEFGSGFISTLSGAAETFTASPDEEDKLLNFRGVAGQSVSATPAVEGLDVKVQGAGLTRFIPRYNGSAHLDIDGGLVTEKVTLAHLGTGVLFDFIGAEERRVYSYNTSSIDFITHPDYGLVADAATTFEDYGDLDLYTGETGWMSTPDIIVDYHGILDNYTNYPFGLLPLKGTSETPRLRAFTGSGTLKVRGDVFIFVPPVWDGQGVITIQGSAEEAFVSREQFRLSSSSKEHWRMSTSEEVTRELVLSRLYLVLQKHLLEIHKKEKHCSLSLAKHKPDSFQDTTVAFFSISMVALSQRKSLLHIRQLEVYSASSVQTKRESALTTAHQLTSSFRLIWDLLLLYHLPVQNQLLYTPKQISVH